MTNELHSRVLNLDDCFFLLSEARRDRRKVVLTNGCFDILHRGHLEYLQKSAKLGDLLIVAVNSDESVRALKGPNRPLQCEGDRAYALACLRFVDAVFIFPGPRLDAEIKYLQPDTYTKAGDYTLDTLDRSEFAALTEVGTDVKIMPFVRGHSTTSLLDRMSH